jgi:polysaccharide export outer membrane protein
MPLIGSVQAAGFTPEELKQSIEAGLRAGYLVNPDVQIILQQYRQEMVHIFGQVGTPGPFRITHQDTLMEIISKAGGFTPIANRKKIKIIRREESGSRVILINAARITDEGRLEEDVPLRPGDVIIVPERFF